MEQLETASDPLADRLFGGHDIRAFSDEEIAVLARWTAKTAAVLSFVTPQQKFVPGRACRSIHPISGLAPQFRFFYAQISGNFRIEGAYVQLAYGAEVPIVGSQEVSGTRVLLALNNHIFIADFPPILEGIHYNLRGSIAAQFWPVRLPAGTGDLGISLPAPVSDVIVFIARSIVVDFDGSAIHA